MGRRGGDVERGREAQKGTMPQRQCGEAAELAVPHSHVVDKNWEGYFRCTGLLAQTRLPSSPGFQHLKDNPQNIWMWKKWALGCGRNCQIIRRLILKVLHRRRIYKDSPPLGFSTRATAGRAQVAYGEKVRRLKTVMAGRQVPPRQTTRSQAAALSPLWAFSPPPQSHKVVKRVALPWQSSKALSHTINRSSLLE